MSSIEQMLSGGSKISLKRVATFVGTLLLVICVITELFTSMEVSKNTFDTIAMFTGGGLATVASEKFTKKKDEVSG